MKITTMTLSAIFSHRIDILKLFPLLEIDGRYGNMTKNNNEYLFDSKIKSFNNCISVDFKYEKKLYKIKIFCSQIQICGIKDVQIVVKLVNSILERLLKLRNILKDLRNYPNIDDTTSEYLDTFLLNLNHKDEHLTWILSLSHHIVPKDLRIVSIKEVMVNHIFEMDYEINMISLYMIFNNKYKDIYVSYENTINDVLVLKIYLEENTVSSFIVRDNGIITQSGNSIYYNKIAREIFIDIFNKNRDLIEWKN